MKKLFVGCRVRLVKSTRPENVGAVGVISHIGMWRHGGILPNGAVLDYPGPGVDLIVDFGREFLTTNGCYFREVGVESERVEPILPEGAAPSEKTFQQLMDSLKEKVA